MNNQESFRAENKELQPMKVDEIYSQLKDLRQAEHKIDMKGKKSNEIISAISKLRTEFVEKLLSEKERFSRVFVTSSGSTYFQLETGETIRAKKMPNKNEFGEGDGEHFNFQPITNNLFFLPQSEVERIRSGGEWYPGEKLKTVGYELGVSPFELNIRGFGSRVAFEENNGELFLTGTEYKDSDGNKTLETDHNLVGGIHIGHPITKIIL